MRESRGPDMGVWEAHPGGPCDQKWPKNPLEMAESDFAHTAYRVIQ